VRVESIFTLSLALAEGRPNPALPFVVKRVDDAMVLELERGRIDAVIVEDEAGFKLQPNYLEFIRIREAK